MTAVAALRDMGAEPGLKDDGVPALAPYSAFDLDAEELPEVDYVVPGVIAVGGTLFVAKPKEGKTYLAINCGYAIATGGKALGSVPCDQGDGLLLALEENKARMKRRLTQLAGDQPKPKGLYIQHEAQRIDTGLLDQIRGWTKTVDRPRLVVVDTLVAVRPLGYDKRSVFQLDYELARSLNDLAHELGIAILIIHHMRKAPGDDIVDTVSGTNGVSAGVDTLMDLRKITGGYELRARGRDVEDAEIGLTFENGRWIKIGTSDEMRMSAQRRLALSALRRAQEPLKASEVAAEMGGSPPPKADTVRRMLDRMVRDGDGVERASASRYRAADHDDSDNVVPFRGPDLGERAPATALEDDDDSPF